MASKFIVLEGLDGAGTTTQARRLHDTLVAHGRSAHVTREPTDGPIGRLLREMLTGKHTLPNGTAIDQATFSLLFAADRIDHWQREITPALDAGAIVISDRYYHSSLAYQGTGAERSWITVLNQQARRPDLTIFLRVRPEVAADRRLAAGRAQELFEELEMQTRVAGAYEEVMMVCKATGEPTVILDGEQPLDDVAYDIAEVVAQLLAGRQLSHS